MRLPEQTLDIAGLRTTAIGEPGASLVVVLLHGYAMTPADLTAFAHSIGTPALFLLPQAPHCAVDRGCGWWEINPEARQAALAAGPRDLANEAPAGLSAARERLAGFIERVRADYSPSLLAIGGFSQGGMLALDFALHAARRPDALFLMSSSRLSLRAWRPLQGRLRGLPSLVSHGRQDADLAFAAGEALRDFLIDSGADASWVPFEGGHEIPLVVWRALRKRLDGLLRSQSESIP